MYCDLLHRTVVLQKRRMPAEIFSTCANDSVKLPTAAGAGPIKATQIPTSGAIPISTSFNHRILAPGTAANQPGSQRLSMASLDSQHVELYAPSAGQLHPTHVCIFLPNTPSLAIAESYRELQVSPLHLRRLQVRRLQEPA